MVVEVKGQDAVALVITDWCRNKRWLSIGEEDWYESRVSLSVVEIVVNDPALPKHTASFICGHSVLHPFQIAFRTDQQNKRRVLRSQLLIAPMRPTLRRSNVVSIQFGIDSVAAKCI